MMDEDGNMNLIEEGIYLGNISATYDLQALLDRNISYILTLDSQPLKNVQDVEGIKNKFICVLDMPAADLLSHFEECFAFIDEALSVPSRGVLVHCIAGVSRSATIVIAYLMYRDKIPLEEAHGIVKEQRFQIKPNPGFTDQLELFEKMGSIVDPEHTLYRKYQLDVLAHKVKTGVLEEVGEDQLRAINSLGGREDLYKCRKCRRLLFKSSSVMSHTVGMGEAAFDWRCKVPLNQRGDIVAETECEEVCDKSLFIEPVKWMAEFIGDMEGKILCPKCRSKLGSFTWYGEKCPCGAWIGPAFHIQTSKVDRIRHQIPGHMTSQVLDHMTVNGNSDPSGASNGSLPDTMKNLSLTERH